MRFLSIRGAIAAAGVILNLPAALAAPTSYCSVDHELCFQWAVPDPAPATTSGSGSNSGNIYFQLRAPTSYSWIALGLGTRMAGSAMFIIYDNGLGNVTISTRPGLKHAMPEYASRPDVALLAGSAVTNGHMIANIRCSNCSALLHPQSSTNWISAWKKGSSLASTSPAERIDYHDGHDAFAVDFSKAVVSADRNPFLGDSPAAADGGAGAGVIKQPGRPFKKDLLYAHGIIMSLVFLIGFPVGSMLMPLLGKWLVHASWQIVFFVLMWAGFGVGYVLSKRWDMFFTQPHTRLGTLLCILMTFQPVLGWLHHQHFVKHQRRGAISHAHIWYGRALIVLGMVNGGLGLQLAHNDRAFVIAYCVIASVFGVLYAGCAVLGGMKRRGSESSGGDAERRK
ncbi:hypothetical protein E4U55_000298 [Claviceps digitariae]|nr:hypothetical protein E4U55_000298 [Claviceps digitariae]